MPSNIRDSRLILTTEFFITAGCPNIATIGKTHGIAKYSEAQTLAFGIAPMLAEHRSTEEY
jgi:hypothetical protein